MSNSYRLIKCQDLDAGLIATWKALIAGSPALSSPYFSPYFTKIVGSVREDVRIVVIEQNGRAVGFFPYQRSGFGLGRPVGGALSDFHGVIAGQGADIDLLGLLRAANLNVWTFDHLVGDTGVYAPFVADHRMSPQINLEEGYELYVENRRKEGSDYIRKTEGLARKLARENGDLRFSFHEPTETVLDQLIRWKREQYHKTGVPDVFGVTWTGQLIKRIASTSESGFSGVCSVLRVGERVIAIHLGMSSGDTLHYWFPAYDPNYSKFSAGIILLLRTAEEGAASGVRTIDLGTGDAQYKQRLMNGRLVLGVGALEQPSLVTSARRLYLKAENATLAGASRKLISLPVRLIRRMKRHQRFR